MAALQLGAMPKRTTARRNASPKKKKNTSVEPKAGRPFAPGYGIVGAKDGQGLIPWTWVSKHMNACRTFWLATIRAGDARPHVMPVWGVWVDDAFFFSTGRKSRKGQNLAANPACTVTNDDGEEAVIVEGSAEEVKDAAALERVAAAYTKKYKMDPRSMGEPIFVVRPRTVFGFIEKTFPKSATRWRL
jgi:nitroimidazol reductase NimA-like FMN-containing flavoprotein (pyridoxamine 5'-phosphate oxidase superfamily)